MSPERASLCSMAGLRPARPAAVRCRPPHHERWYGRSELVGVLLGARPAPRRERIGGGHRAGRSGKYARDLPERAPRPPSRSPTACYTTPRVSRGNAVRGRAAVRVVRWVPWVRIAEVRGSNPLSSTSRNDTWIRLLAPLAGQPGRLVCGLLRRAGYALLAPKLSKVKSAGPPPIRL
jgi:hypothetical protein